MPSTRWGDAISRLLAERGWTKRQLAAAASIRPNTLTNLVRHGRDSDTVTLARIAKALGVDIAELFLTPEQSSTFRAYRENRIERLKEMVVKELSETVKRLVMRELERVGEVAPAEEAVVQYERPSRKRSRRAKKRAGRQIVEKPD